VLKKKMSPRMTRIAFDTEKRRMVKEKRREVKRKLWRFAPFFLVRRIYCCKGIFISVGMLFFAGLEIVLFGC